MRFLWPLLVLIGVVMQGAIVERVYQPRGGCDELFDAYDDEVLLEGPADTGKSRGIAELIFRDLAGNPGARIAAVRKTRASLTESFLATWEDEVLGGGADRIYLRPDSWVGYGAGRANRHDYKFRNGSILVLASMENPTRLYSTQWDKVYIQEAVEVTLDQWERITRSLRYEKIPHPLGGIDPRTGKPRNINQLLADTNPDAPGHWLNLRCLSGKTRRILCRHEDNPSITESRLQRLRNMTGVRRARLYEGKWVASEGSIWGNWEPEIHWVKELPKGLSGDAIGSIDWGWTGAGCILIGRRDPWGRVYVVRQVYQPERMLNWWATKALHLKAEFRVKYFVADPSRPDNIRTLRHHGVAVAEADNDVMTGLDAVRDRLATAEDGKPRLFVYRTSLEERDGSLLEASKPTCLEDEIPAYVFAKSADGSYIKEEPAKQQADHACDALRYLVKAFDRLGNPPPPPKPQEGPLVFPQLTYRQMGVTA